MWQWVGWEEVCSLYSPKVCAKVNRDAIWRNPKQNLTLGSALQWQDLNGAFVQYLTHCSQGSNGPFWGDIRHPQGNWTWKKQKVQPMQEKQSDGVFFQQARLLPTYQDTSPKQTSFWKRKSSSPGLSWL